MTTRAKQPVMPNAITAIERERDADPGQLGSVLVDDVTPADRRSARASTPGDPGWRAVAVTVSAAATAWKRSNPRRRAT